MITEATINKIYTGVRRGIVTNISALPATNSAAPTLDQGIGAKRSDIIVAEFVVSTLNERNHQLDSAVATAKSKASLDRRFGVFVTRHDFRRFSAWLTSDVQHGTIEERDWAPSATPWKAGELKCARSGWAGKVSEGPKRCT